MKSKSMSAPLLRAGDEIEVGQYAMSGDTVVVIAQKSDKGTCWINYVQDGGTARGGGGGSSGWWRAEKFKPIVQPRALLLARLHYARSETKRLRELANRHEKAALVYDAAVDALDDSRALEPGGERGE